MKELFAHIWTFVTGVSASLWHFVEPILSQETGSLLNQLLPIALQVVTQVAQTGDLPNAKRDAAYAQLKSAALAAGLDASGSLLNAAIELAYQHYQISTAAPVGGSQPVAAVARG